MRGIQCSRDDTIRILYKINRFLTLMIEIFAAEIWPYRSDMLWPAPYKAFMKPHLYVGHNGSSHFSSRRTHLLYPSHTPKAEWTRMPSEWKFCVYSWMFEVHYKTSEWLSAFQISGPILGLFISIYLFIYLMICIQDSKISTRAVLHYGPAHCSSLSCTLVR